MNLINAPELHQAVKFLKSLRIQKIEKLPHEAQYGLFFRNDEITTGLMKDTFEIKVNLLTGNFHYYDTEHGWTYDLTSSDAPAEIIKFLNLTF